MNLAPLNLIDAHPWQRVAFTTYAVSLSFFEAVILDRLVRGGGSQAIILADVHGYRASLSEQGAQQVGKAYELEPVAVAQGVFHPKLTVFAAGDECHLLVGSGNLTFNGWGGNCEILEHLHPSFAADAIADAADFFEWMPGTPRIRQSAAAQCAAIAADSAPRAITVCARGAGASSGPARASSPTASTWRTGIPDVVERVPSLTGEEHVLYLWHIR